MVLKILGWDFAGVTLFQALGVQLDVSRLSKGLCWLATQMVREVSLFKRWKPYLRQASLGGRNHEETIRLSLHARLQKGTMSLEETTSLKYASSHEGNRIHLKYKLAPNVDRQSLYITLSNCIIFYV